MNIHVGDCREIMGTLPESSVDAIVTDPPYGIRFMGKAWDGADIERRFVEANTDLSARARTGRAAAAGKYDLRNAAMISFQQWTAEWAAEALRVLKPGGYILVFASTRTYHRMVSGLEDAGFQIRDQIGWVFGSGFPKSHNGEWGGTALKPAWEPICMARKPLIGTVEANWREHGTGALNIDACRIPGGEGGERAGEESADRKYTESGVTNFSATPGPRGGDAKGRWPANLIHDGSDEVAALFPREAGAAAPVHKRNSHKFRTAYGSFAGNIDEQGSTFHSDTGSAARFFYCAKASREDRDDGMDGVEKKPLNWSSGTKSPGTFQSPNTERAARNNHPTVKPLDLMRYLCRLVTPRGGVILDPFMGSGSTGRAALLEQFQFIGIELNPEYADIARRRISSTVPPLFAEAAL